MANTADDYANWIVQNADKKGSPEFDVVAQAYREAVASEDDSKPQLAAPTLRQKVQSSMPMRVVQGMRDPIDAGAQLLPHGLEALTSLGGYAPNPVSEFFGGEANRVDQINSQNEREYQDARTATTAPDLSSLVTGKRDPGFDGARLLGNVVSPVNAAIAARLPMTATTIPGLAWHGGKIGAVGGALQPVNEIPEAGFWPTKAAQTGFGFATGAVLTPVVSKVGEKVATWIAKRGANKEIATAQASIEADRVIREALAEVNQSIDDIPRANYDMLRQQVVGALKSGKKLDAAALMRKQDFDAEGVQPLQGWITRDPSQYAQEMNLRGIDGVGAPIMQRYDAANNHLQNTLRKAAGGADSPFADGERLAGALNSYDDHLRGQVTSAYQQARSSAGKDLDVPLQGLAQDMAQVVSEFGDKVPSGVRNQFKDLGLDGGTQLKVFTIEEADKLLKVINANWSNDPATNAALSRLSQAVKRAVTDVDATGGPFAPAVSLAAQRFKLHEAVPALEAASTGRVAPDDFVNRFILRGKVNDVRGMVKVLDPESLQQARAQVGAYLQRAGFGENTAGDKVFAPERYAKALREFGDEKLAAFFNPQEIESLKRAARIGAYVNSRPNVSPVNSSNTASVMANLLGNNVSKVSRVAALANAVAAPIKNANAVNRALRPEVPVKPGNLTPEQIAILSRLLSGGAAAGGSVSATPFR